jgi:hypothetical protein
MSHEEHYDQQPDQEGNEEHIAKLLSDQVTLIGKSDTSNNPKRVKAANPKRPPVSK